MNLQVIIILEIIGFENNFCFIRSTNSDWIKKIKTSQFNINATQLSKKYKKI